MVRKKLECVFIHAELYDILASEMRNRIPYNQKKTLYELYNERNQEVKELWIKYNSNSDEYDKSCILYHEIMPKLFKTSAYGYEFSIMILEKAGYGPCRRRKRRRSTSCHSQWPTSCRCRRPGAGSGRGWWSCR